MKKREFFDRAVDIWNKHAVNESVELYLDDLHILFDEWDGDKEAGLNDTEDKTGGAAFPWQCPYTLMLKY